MSDSSDWPRRDARSPQGAAGARASADAATEDPQAVAGEAPGDLDQQRLVLGYAMVPAITEARTTPGGNYPKEGAKP